MASPNIRIDIASEFKERGFKQASKASTGLDRQFKKLARTFATVFSVTAITQFGKQAVRAFEEDEAAARRLTTTLGNLGMAFEDPNVTRFISDLESATGVLDDALRPAMSRLLTTTASFVKSQELMTLAIDVSRGSSIALETVVSDLSRAYVGQTRGLAKYGLGLTQVELQTKTFAELQDILNNRFGGQSQAFLETYSGKISLLNVAYANMSETIGESLVDAMIMAAGQDGIAGLTAAMEDFGDEMADVIRGVGVLLSVLDKIPGIKGDGIAGAITSPFGIGLKALSELGKRTDKTLMFPTAGIGQPAIDAQRAKIEKERLKREKELERLRLKAAKDAAKRAEEARKKEIATQALKKAGAIFDLEKIQIQAALQGKITAEEKLRLQLMQAIIDENAAKAAKLTADLTKAQADTKLLAESMSKFVASDPFAFWATYFATQKKERDDLDKDLNSFDANDPFSFWGAYWAMQKKERDALDKDIKDIKGGDPFADYPDKFKAQKDAVDALDKDIKDIKAGDPFSDWGGYVDAAYAKIHALQAAAGSVGTLLDTTQSRISGIESAAASAAAAAVATAQAAADAAAKALAESTAKQQNPTLTTPSDGTIAGQIGSTVTDFTIPGLENINLSGLDIFAGLENFGGTNVIVNVAGSVTTQGDLLQAIYDGLLQLQKDGTTITLSPTEIP